MKGTLSLFYRSLFGVLFFITLLTNINGTSVSQTSKNVAVIRGGVPALERVALGNVAISASGATEKECMKNLVETALSFSRTLPKFEVDLNSFRDASLLPARVVESSLVEIPRQMFFKTTNQHRGWVVMRVGQKSPTSYTCSLQNSAAAIASLKFYNAKDLKVFQLEKAIEVKD